VKTSKNSDTTGNFLKENPWYPRLESDRADELIAELDEAQVLRLYNELKTKTHAGWLLWLEDARGVISTYDYLSRAQRKRRLQKKPDTGPLLLHHACIFVELWRARINREYFCLPPSGPDLDTPEAHRSMMLDVVTALDHGDDRDLWPFDHPTIEDNFPFRHS
jgi:hypothetical protein